MADNRFDRQIRFFGKEGQDMLHNYSVAVVGVGGLGSHVVQQLALLGLKSLVLIDGEELSETNRNRYVTALDADPVPGSAKVELAERLVTSINSEITVVKIPDTFISEIAFNNIIQADCVFGCLDSEGARLILTELCAAYSRPYIDLASEIIPGNPLIYGGRVCTNWEGKGCLVCRGEIDLEEAIKDLANPTQRRDRQNLYGVDSQVLHHSGPSVVSINGIIASLAVTEYMVQVTGIRRAKPLLYYRGNTGIVTSVSDPPKADCFYCKSIWGQRDQADVQRYIREQVGAF